MTRALSARALAGCFVVALCATVALSGCASVSDPGAATSGPDAPPTAGAPAASAATSRREPRRVVNVPASIDPSGSRDVQQELQALVDQAPPGTAIVLQPGGRYRLERALWINDKRNVTIDGNGARIDLPSSDLGFGSIGFHISNSTGTTIHDLTMVGNNSEAGSADACCTRENNHAIAVLSSDDTLIENVEIRRIWGDCVYVRHFDEQHGDWSERLTFRDSTCRLTGRHGVTINAGSQVEIVDNVFDDIGYAVVGIEPNRGDQGATDVVIRNNQVGSYSLTDEYKGYLFYACDATWIDAPSTVRNVTLTGNTVEGNRNGKAGEMVGLNVKICGDRGNRLDFTVTNNTANQPVVGPVMEFTNVKGVTVTGNTQPLASGSLATFTGSTVVTSE